MSASSGEKKILLIVLAILLPPVAVGLVRGFGIHFVINLVLTIVGVWILGNIHALYVVLKG